MANLNVGAMFHKEEADTGRTGLLSSDGITVRAGGGAVMPCCPTSRHQSDSSKKKKPGGVTRRELPVPLRKIIGDLSDTHKVLVHLKVEFSDRDH